MKNMASGQIFPDNFLIRLNEVLQMYNIVQTGMGCCAAWRPVQWPHMHLGALYRSNQVYRNTFYVRIDKGMRDN